jgi:4,5-dihydroxyphthalate decarboxylase
MTQPRLKIAIATYGHTKDVKSGAAAIAGVEPDFVEVVPIIGAFRRMVRDIEFDVCEMAPTTYMIARALGAPFIALPIFLMRRFHHGGFVVRPDSGIKTPKDLEGKQVGVRAYSVTTGVWTRGIFVNEYGLDSSKVTWVVDDEEHVTTLKLPPNVVHAPEGKSLASMMAGGELQAGFSGPAGIGRAGPPTGAWEQRAQASTVAYTELIANVTEVEAQWFRRTGIYPIHGLVVIDRRAGAVSRCRPIAVRRVPQGEGSVRCAPESRRWRQRGRREISQDDGADERSPALRHGGEPREHRGSGHL